MSNAVYYVLLCLAGFVIGYFGSKCYFSWRGKKHRDDWLKEMASKYPFISEAGEKNLKDAYNKLMKEGFK